MPLSKLLLSFEGRIPRRTFWYYLLGVVLAWAAAAALDYLVGRQDPTRAYGCATLGVWFVAILTGAAIFTKRAHDTDRSATFVLLAFIPILGLIYLIAVLGTQKGTVGANGFGPDPLQERAI
jgi:uncharacterized membrane protein YhaH (DUF805 family)